MEKKKTWNYFKRRGTRYCRYSGGGKKKKKKQTKKERLITIKYRKQKRRKC